MLKLATAVILFATLCAPVYAQGPAKKRPLGPTVNTTTHRELLPVISPDGQTLWFIREGVDTAMGDRVTSELEANLKTLEAQLEKLPPEQRKMLEDVIRQNRAAAPKLATAGPVKQTVFKSTRQPDGSWGPAQRQAAPLNNEVSNSGVVTALPDGNTLLVGTWKAGDPFGDFAKQIDPNVNLLDVLKAAAPGSKAAPPPLVAPDPARDDQNKVIGFSRRRGAAWSDPQLLKVIGYAHQAGVRSDYFLAPNGRALILSLVNSESQNRSRDLFISLIQADGRWSKPANVATLNSPQEEISPWLAPDNQTLYFSSGRAGGLGENDIWMSRRLDDSWLKWSPPQNLGADINTKQADMNLAVDATGRMAFMSLGERGKEDLYEFELPAAMRPLPVAFVYGTATDPAGKPVPAGILYEFLKNTQLAGQAGANPQDGKYQIALPIGEDYGFRASASGYIAISDRIDLRQAKDQQRYERNLVLIPIATDVPIRLNNIFFDTAKTELLPESRAELDRLATLLRDMPAMRIEIRGHTDTVDDDAFNLKLSEGRAAAVVAFLAKAGIAGARLRSRGFGESQPIAPNDTEKNRLLNRRVEFVILSR
ncbi:MAG: OmpA family protein [Vicinamibacterales bacterium]|jgi:outer membrane protein OmpA-like peptidoglycan-associated protein